MLLNKIKKITAMVLSATMLIGLTACGSQEEFNIPEKLGKSLTWTNSMELSYATEFSVDYYVSRETDAKYKLFSIVGDGQYLLVPEGTEPLDKEKAGLPEDIRIITGPKDIYLVATQTMDMFSAIEGLDNIRYSSLNAEDWYIPEAADRVRNGKIQFAGKYSAPDYEMILQGGCDLAIENTMIYHTPEVKEKLESFDIPVLVDHSSYEKHPFGRMEWVKLYGALIGKEDAAQKVFDEQVSKSTAIEKKGETPTVAFFYIAANGSVKVRKSVDYIPKMIEMAGGKYIFDKLGAEDDNASSTVNMQMEEFYATAKDADFIIYNSTIEGELENLQDLLAKNDLLASMKAVKEGHVYCTSQNVYQSTMETGTIIEDINKMLSYNEDMKYIFKLK